MARKGKDWKKLLTNEVLLRIIQIVDERENGIIANFASKTEIDESTLYVCLDRDSTPKVDTLVKIRNTYGISLDWLICGSDDIKKSGKKDLPKQTLESRIEKLEKDVKQLKKRG